MRLFGSLLALTLFACWGEGDVVDIEDFDRSGTCRGYIEAVEDCYSNSAGDSGIAVPIDDSVCESAEAREISAELYACYHDAYANGDCHTPEGINAIAAQLGDCGG